MGCGALFVAIPHQTSRLRRDVVYEACDASVERAQSLNARAMRACESIISEIECVSALLTGRRAYGATWYPSAVDIAAVVNCVAYE